MSKKSQTLFYIKHRLREALLTDRFDIEGPHVQEVIDEYMDKKTDLYDSDDINNIIDQLIDTFENANPV